MRKTSSQMAGWLFADLLLALVIVFIGSEVRHHRTDILAPNQTQQATPSPSATRKLDGKLDPEFKDIPKNSEKAIAVNEDLIIKGSQEELAQMWNRVLANPTVRQLDQDARYAAVVEVFSWDSTPNLSKGMNSSKKICEWFKLQQGIFDNDTICVPYFKKTSSGNQIELRLFLVAK